MVDVIARSFRIVVPLVFFACPKDPAAARPQFTGPPRVIPLFTAVPEAETATRVERRTDVVPLGEGTEATAAIVAKVETPEMVLGGGRARLFGDDKGTEGWSVDNAILFEIVGPGGVVGHRFAVGYHDGLRIGSEEVDNFGRKTFQFTAGEVDITPLLPETATFKLRATAIDTGNVGRVSNVFLIIGPPRNEGPDDLQNR
jgi:hypothetical protein